MLDDENLNFMSLAIDLAKKGCGYVSPNPMVGAVIVKNNTIIGSGYHEKYGTLHAERNAFKNCSSDASGADIYVTLEPCCHYGKTPPCTDAIVQNNIKRVFIGSPDPNPLVAGKGIKILRENNIEVFENVMRKECDEINEVFFHFITTQTPYVVLKYAMTIDGKIACYSGESKWVTGESARYNVHLDRHKYSGIMVGVGTVIADNPMLDCRIENGNNPVRIVCDTNLRTPLDSNIVNTASQIRTVIATSSNQQNKINQYLDKGCEVIHIKRKNNHIDLNLLMLKLAKMNIDSILLEGGSELNWSALENGIVNKVQAYISPKIFGGSTAKSPIGGIGVDSPNKAFMLDNPKISRFDNDILIESRVIKCLQE